MRLASQGAWRHLGRETLFAEKEKGSSLRMPFECCSFSKGIAQIEPCLFAFLGLLLLLALLFLLLLGFFLLLVFFSLLGRRG